MGSVYLCLLLHVALLSPPTFTILYIPSADSQPSGNHNIVKAGEDAVIPEIAKN